MVSALATELESLEADMGLETESDVPSYLLPDKEPELDSDMQLPAAPSGQAASAQANPQVSLRTQLQLWGLPVFLHHGHMLQISKKLKTAL